MEQDYDIGWVICMNNLSFFIFLARYVFAFQYFHILLFWIIAYFLKYDAYALTNRSTIRDKIIPHAVSWFTGEAAQDEFGDMEDDEDIDEDDEEDEDEDEDEEDEDEDEDEEEEEQPKNRKKVIKHNKLHGK